MRIVFLLLFMFGVFSSEAQVGINTTSPNPASILDVSATDKGILVPRVALDNIANTQIDGINTVPEGMLIYNSNASTVGGSGVGFYFFNQSNVWEKLTGGVSSTDSDWFIENTTNSATTINDNIYTQGNVSIGRTDTPSPLSLHTTTETTVLDMEMNVAGDDVQYLQDFSASNTGAGAQFGSRYTLSKNGTGQQIGISQNLGGNTEGIKIGVSTTLSGDGGERFFGLLNTISGDGNERKFGIANTVYGDGNGRKFGTSNTIYGAGSGTYYGVSNSVRGTGNNSRYGTSNSMTGSGTGRSYGTSNSISGTNTGWLVGVSNSISSDADGNNYAVFNTLTGDGDGTHYATYNDINNDGNGTKYGEYSYINAVGTGIKYGNYITVTNASQGDHYGLYVNMGRSTGTVFAGYFLGNVAVGTTTANTYTFPSSRGTAGQVMQTDAAGQLSWVTPTFPEPLSGETSENKSEIQNLKHQIASLKTLLKAQQEQIDLLSKSFLKDDE